MKKIPPPRALARVVPFAFSLATLVALPSPAADIVLTPPPGGAVVVDGNLELGFSTATTGNITKGGYPFLKDYGGTFLGLGAGNFTMTGSGNAAIGYLALPSVTTGSYNVAAGYGALGADTTGAQNVAVGAFAAPANTSGANNVAIGTQALYNNTTGFNNIAIGLSAGINLTTGNNNIVIGSSGVAGEGTTIRIGGQFTHTKAFLAGVRGITTVNANAIPVLIDSLGQLGTVSSSRAVKDDIADMDAASAALMRLRPVTFHYKADPSRHLEYGLIAEEVAEVMPQLVAHSDNGKIETVMYQYLPPMLLNEVQKLQRTVGRQAEEIAQLKELVGKLVAERR